jgi:threonine aldolase
LTLNGKVEKNLDFRSDTVTWPSPEMREAAYKAKLGDDVYGEDPTVNELESIAAEIFHKEAGLLVTSGTQGNAVAVLSQTQRGDEIILEERSHLYLNEVGGIAVMGQLMTRTINGVEGWMTPEDIRRSIRADNIHLPKTSLVCIENTHNIAGGVPLTIDQMRSSWEVARENNLAVHLDGARVFNAAISLSVDVKDLAQYVDTVQVCLTKGLAAPVGSLVVGPKFIIDKARKYRKMLGGGMRQAGIIAAPGIIAITKMVDRLADDHKNAKILADGLEKLGIKVINKVQTNMVYIDFGVIGWTAEDWLKACIELGWKSRARYPTRTRLCTHYGIEEEDIRSFLEGIEKLI